MPLEGRTQPPHRRTVGIFDAQDRMRISHGDRAEIDCRAVHLERIGSRFGAGPHGQGGGMEIRLAHVHRHQPILADESMHLAARASHHEVPAESRRTLVHERRDTARAVPALLDLARVGVENSIEDAARGAARRLEHQGLVETDAGVTVGERAQRAGVQGGGGGVEHEEVVAEPLHLQKLESHASA